MDMFIDYYMLHPPFRTKNKNECAHSIVVGLLLVDVSVVLECQSMGATFNISNFMECIIGGNMALY